MTRTILSIATLVAFAAFLPAQASAQDFDDFNVPGDDAVSLSILGGGFFSGNDLGDGTEFDNSAALGGTATYWTGEHVGLRGNLFWASPDVSVGTTAGTNPLTNEDPTIWSYSGDLVLRMPMAATDEVSWFPYILGGIGAKTYDFETLGTESDLAADVGAGVEVRFGEFGSYGIVTEVRDYISDFERLGFDQSMNDFIWTGGLTLNF